MCGIRENIRKDATCRTPSRAGALFTSSRPHRPPASWRAPSAARRRGRPAAGARDRSPGCLFWLGCANGEYDSLVGLMPPGRSLDVANQWETEGPYLDVAVRNTTGWHNQRPHEFLAAGAAVQWNSSPFCSGSTMVVPEPGRPGQRRHKDYHLNCSPAADLHRRGDRASGSPSSAGCGRSRPTAGWSRSGARRCSPSSATTSSDRTCRNIRIVAARLPRAEHRHDLGRPQLPPRLRHDAAADVGDYLLVQEAIRRYFAVFLDVFGNTQASIAGDYAYADRQLWPYWNTDKNHRARSTCG